MSRKQKKYHYIYKTTCIITKKYYIGMHSTNNLNDNYIGSGKILKSSIKKYGKENHKIEILEYLPNREELNKRENKIVNESLLNDNLCMNIRVGGMGGLSGYVVVRDNDAIISVPVNDPRYLSGELKNLTEGRIPVRDVNGNTFMVSTDDPRYLSGELKNLTEGLVPVRDRDGKTFMVPIDDPRYLSGELVHPLKGRVSVRDKNGNTFSTYTNDPRYLSGELVSAKKDIPLSESHRKNLSKVTKGTIWINNGIKNKRITKDKINEFKDWKNGRIKFNKQSSN